MPLRLTEARSGPRLGEAQRLWYTRRLTANLPEALRLTPFREPARLTVPRTRLTPRRAVGERQ